jgi:hypothetical protein
MADQVQHKQLEDLVKELNEIREEFRKRRKDLRKSQEAYGVLQTIHGGFTYRLGNEVEDFEERFGLAK